MANDFITTDDTRARGDGEPAAGESVPVNHQFVDSAEIGGGEPPAGDSGPNQYVDAGELTEEREARLFAESEADSAATKTDASDSFLAARGTFYRVPLRSGSGPGLYAVEGLSQFMDNARKEKNEQLRRLKFESNFQSLNPISSIMEEQDPEAYHAALNNNQQIEAENVRRQNEDRAQASDKDTLATTPILILGIEITQTDIVSAVSCLGNVKVFYTFGQAFGNVVIRGEMLLGPLGSVQSDGVRLLNDYFQAQRVSNLKKATIFSVSKTAYKMYMTGLMIGNIDVEFHILPFVIAGVLIDPSNQDNSLMNPDNQVITTGASVEVTPENLDDVSVTPTLATTEQVKAAIDAHAAAHEIPKLNGLPLTPGQQDELNGLIDAENRSGLSLEEFQAARKAHIEAVNLINGNNQAGATQADTMRILSATAATKATNEQNIKNISDAAQAEELSRSSPNIPKVVLKTQTQAIDKVTIYTGQTQNLYELEKLKGTGLPNSRNAEWKPRL